MNDQYQVRYSESTNDTNEVIGFISDGMYEVPFSLKKGKNNSEKKLLVILHGHGANKNFAKYHSDEWDILCPLDMYGTEGLGCWWLGEEGDFFVYRLLQKLITQVKSENGIQKLFFWGSSMGGYGAILHGIELKADAVYAHMPQVRLKGTNYTDGMNAKYYSAIFSEEMKYADLIKIIEERQNSSGPVFFLSQNIFDYPDYVEQHFLPLITILSQKNMAYKVNMNLKKGHVLHERIFESVNSNFIVYGKAIDNWKKHNDIEGVSVACEKKFIKKVNDELSVNISNSEKGLFVFIKKDLGKDYYYACYVYDNNELLAKTNYQKNMEFFFNRNMISKRTTTKIKVYVRDRISGLRTSRFFIKH